MARPPKPIDGRLPTLLGRRVRLRWLEERDIPALFDIFSHPEVMRYWITPPMAGEDEARQLVKDVHECFQRGDLYEWGVARIEDDLIIGTCTMGYIDWSNGRAEIGYALGRPFWGSGLAAESLHLLLTHAFDEMDFRRLEADVDPRNGASIRLLERLGFRREGYLRERWCVDGEIQDAILFGLLKREWTGYGAPRQRSS